MFKRIRIFLVIILIAVLVVALRPAEPQEPSTYRFVISDSELLVHVMDWQVGDTSMTEVLSFPPSDDYVISSDGQYYANSILKSESDRHVVFEVSIALVSDVEKPLVSFYVEASNRVFDMRFNESNELVVRHTNPDDVFAPDIINWYNANGELTHTSNLPEWMCQSFQVQGHNLLVECMQNDPDTFYWVGEGYPAVPLNMPVKSAEFCGLEAICLNEYSQAHGLMKYNKYAISNGQVSQEGETLAVSHLNQFSPIFTLGDSLVRFGINYEVSTLFEVGRAEPIALLVSGYRAGPDGEVFWTAFPDRDVIFFWKEGHVGRHRGFDGILLPFLARYTWSIIEL